MNVQKKILSSLNEEQKQVVLTTEGKLLVLAGAGSGKTKTIVSRISYLISKEYKPSSILTLTFTNKAANEMQERAMKQLEELDVELQSKPELKTFHSWGLDFLSYYHNEIGLKDNWTICNEDKQKKILKDLLINFSYLENINIDTIVSIFSMFQNFLLHDYNSLKKMKEKLFIFLKTEQQNKKDITWFTKFIINKYQIDEIIKLFIFYKKTLISHNLADFDDLINLPIEIIQNNKNIQKKLKSRYEYVMVDEYQDTNNAQNELLKYLSQNGNICVVGDDNQSIYSWRGSDIDYILEFNKIHADVQVFSLKTNYRSASNILEIANKLIKDSTNRHELKEDLQAYHKHKGVIELISGETEQEEFKNIIEKIKYLVKYEKKKFSDITILFRYKSLTLNLEKELLEQRIPYRFKNSNSLVERKEIKGIINLLNLIINNNDNQALIEVLETLSNGIGKKTIENMLLLSINEKKSLFEICKDDLLLKEFNILKRKNQSEEIENLISKINVLSKEYKKLKDNEDVGSFILLMEDMFKFKEFYTKNIKPSREEIMDLNEINKNIVLSSDSKNLDDFTTDMLKKKRIYNIDLFYSLLEDVKNINKFLISLNLDENEDENDNKINLMTIHASKGLEFDSVFIIRLNKGIFPIEQSLENQNKYNEELRLMYVAITRAEKNLYFSYSREKFDLKNKKKIKLEPSIFLKKIL